ncbi:response regulator [Cytobacillus sp. Hz8]|uniref:response regulator transcription factor n=1 Tax=Cytobacillus sp. Hz8 TaxID=3347168 RepID=UPI0035DB9165
MNEDIKVMIVDDDPDWRMGLQRYFSGYKQINLIFCAATIEECFTFLHKEPIDIVLMDIMLSHSCGSGLDAALDIAIQFPNVKVIMLSSVDQNDEIFNEAFLNGAYEYVYKHDFNQLPEIMIRSMENEPHKFGERLRKLVYEKKKSLLSEGDKELLIMILEGKTQVEISQEFCVSLAAIKKRTGRIMKKFDWQRSSKELAEKCRKWGLF